MHDCLNKIKKRLGNKIRSTSFLNGAYNQNKLAHFLGAGHLSEGVILAEAILQVQLVKFKNTI